MRHFGMDLDADDPYPMVVFSGKLCSDEVWADMSVSVHEDVPVLAFKCLLSSAEAGGGGGANDSDMTTALGGQSLDH